MAMHRAPFIVIVWSALSKKYGPMTSAEETPHHTGLSVDAMALHKCTTILRSPKMKILFLHVSAKMEMGLVSQDEF